jgi:hypothetical protein
LDAPATRSKSRATLASANQTRPGERMTFDRQTAAHGRTPRRSSELSADYFAALAAIGCGAAT